MVLGSQMFVGALSGGKDVLPSASGGKCPIFQRPRVRPRRTTAPRIIARRRRRRRRLIEHTHTHTQPFNGRRSGTARVGRYQKKQLTHSHPSRPDHRTSFINFLHLLRSTATFVPPTHRSSLNYLGDWSDRRTQGPTGHGAITRDEDWWRSSTRRRRRVAFEVAITISDIAPACADVSSGPWICRGDDASAPAAGQRQPHQRLITLHYVLVIVVN